MQIHYLRQAVKCFEIVKMKEFSVDFVNSFYLLNIVKEILSPENEISVVYI